MSQPRRRPESQRRKSGPKRPEDLDPVVQRLLDVGEWERAIDLCRYIGEASGIDPASAYKTLDRHLTAGEGVPRLWVRLIAEMTDANEEWLWTGRGPRYRPVRRAGSYGRGAVLMLHRFEALTPEQRKLWWWLGDLLPHFVAEVRQWCETHQELIDARMGGRWRAAHPDTDGEAFQDYSRSDEDADDDASDMSC